MKNAECKMQNAECGGDNIRTQEEKFRQGMEEVTDALLGMIRKAVQELDLSYTSIKCQKDTEEGKLTTEKREAAPGGTVDRGGLKQITGALKDLRDLRLPRSELDIREQEMKIAQLEKQIGGENPEITVRMEETLEDFSR